MLRMLPTLALIHNQLPKQIHLLKLIHQQKEENNKTIITVAKEVITQNQKVVIMPELEEMQPEVVTVDPH